MRGLGLVLFLAMIGCTTYRDELARSERAFDQNDPDRTMALLRDLEPDYQHLTPNEQASYAYIRGMTDYNVGYRADARHWLSVANAYEQVTPGALAGDRKAKTTTALADLNKTVFEDGNTQKLVNARKDAPAAADAGAPAATSATPNKKGPAPASSSKPASDPSED